MKHQSKILIVLAIILSVCSVMFVSACGGKALQLSAPTNLAYDGEKFTWDTVKDAEGYTVQINDGAEIPVALNEFGYNANRQNVKLTVKATSKSAAKVEAQESSMTFTYLGKVEDSDFGTPTDDGLITWTAVAGATAYEVQDRATGIVTAVYTTEYQLPVGTMTFRVRPIVSGNATVYSEWSTARELTKCDKPDADKIAYDGAYITWSAVKGAHQYAVSINGVPADANATGCKYAYDAQTEDFMVSIKPIGNHSTTFDGEVSLDKSFVFLEMVTGLKIADGAIHWDGDDSKTYLLKIDNKEIEVSGSKYQGSEIKTDKTMLISIKEISKDSTYFSNYTDPMSAYILPAPILKWSEGVSLDGDQNNFYWEAVSGAKGYTITITRPDGEQDTQNLSDEVINFGGYAYEDVGEYKITIKANAAEGDATTSSSKESAAFTVVRPGAPERAENFIVSDRYSVEKGFTVTCKTNSNAYQYKLYKNGTQDGEPSTKPQFVRKNLVTAEDIVAIEDTYEIQILGKINSSNRVTLNSLERLSFKIKVLAMPQEVRMDGYKLVYQTVTGAQYGYYITGAQGGSGIEGDGTGADLSGHLSAGHYNIQVCSIGNGSDVLPSNYSPIVKVFRIGKPTNIKIDTAVAGNGVLRYDVDAASSLEIYLGSATHQEKVENPDTALENMNDYIKESGTYVSLVAVANELRSDDVYYMTSERSSPKEFIKIAAPTNISFTNTHIRWNQTGINESQVGKMTYDIYNSVNNVKFSPSLSARECDISMLEGGSEYEFYIRAIGDGEKYINSEPSKTDTVYKLESPDVIKKDGKYTWFSVANAVSYSVTVDNQSYETSIHQSNNVFEFSPKAAFESVKTYKVVITAVGNGGVGSTKIISSKPVEITQNVVQLAKPEFSLSYDRDCYDSEGNIVVTVTDTVDFSTGYRYSVSGKVTEKLHTEGDATTLYYNAQNATAYDVAVQAIGGMFNDNGDYTIISQYPTAKTIIILPLPNYDSIILNGDGYIEWGAIQGADKYELSISLNGGTAIDVVTNKSSYNLAQEIYKGTFDGFTNYTEVVSLTITLRACGVTTSVVKVNSQLVTKDWTNLH